MAVTPTQAPATAAGPEIKDPTLTQQLMLDAPFGDDLCVISARGTGKSWGIVMLVARDAAHWKERYSCLITRTTYQGLMELQGLLWRYLSVAFPGTTYSGGDMTFRVGGKDMPFGRVELAYTGAGPAEQVLQSRCERWPGCRAGASFVPSTMRWETTSTPGSSIQRRPR